MTSETLMPPAAEAVAEWLLTCAIWDEGQAKEEWSTQGVTLVQCGRRFCAIRLPLPLVNGAAGSDDPATVDTYLETALHGAPVFRGVTGQWLYVLVESSGAARWTVHGIECIRDQQLGVPRPDLIGYPGRTASYWAVPMSRPGELGTVSAVSQLVAHGRHRVAQQEGT
ncbi:hypothetical protein [Streptomyces shenzhenensis]|uniref:hypothetical protein n=1 Tax=Streptomyces shenzhenensis TaxID=943815 RepID=UPI0036762E9C